MIQSVFFLILIMSVINTVCTTRIGYIYNTTYASTTNTSVVITYRNTCSECICQAFFSRVPSLYVGLNCYTNNKTCTLFTNYSSPSTVTINLNSTFIFIQQPPLENTTAGNETFIFCFESHCTRLCNAGIPFDQNLR
jgi:hypothetical protein